MLNAAPLAEMRSHTISPPPPPATRDFQLRPSRRFSLPALTRGCAQIIRIRAPHSATPSGSDLRHIGGSCAPGTVVPPTAAATFGDGLAAGGPSA
jgi:hypothetical protein